MVHRLGILGIQPPECLAGGIVAAAGNPQTFELAGIATDGFVFQCTGMSAFRRDIAAVVGQALSRGLRPGGARRVLALPLAVARGGARADEAR